MRVLLDDGRTLFTEASIDSELTHLVLHMTNTQRPVALRSIESICDPDDVWQGGVHTTNQAFLDHRCSTLLLKDGQFLTFVFDAVRTREYFEMCMKVILMAKGFNISGGANVSSPAQSVASRRSRDESGASACGQLQTSGPGSLQMLPQPPPRSLDITSAPDPGADPPSESPDNPTYMLQEREFAPGTPPRMAVGDQPPVLSRAGSGSGTPPLPSELPPEPCPALSMVPPVPQENERGLGPRSPPAASPAGSPGASLSPSGPAKQSAGRWNDRLVPHSLHRESEANRLPSA